MTKFVSEENLLEVLSAVNTMFVTLMCVGGLDRTACADQLEKSAAGRNGLAAHFLSGVAEGIRTGSHPPKHKLHLVHDASKLDNESK